MLAVNPLSHSKGENKGSLIKLLTNLRQIKLTSRTGHFERRKALQRMESIRLVELYNYIVSESIRLDALTDKGWLDAISATLISLGVETRVHQKYTIGLPSTNTYIRGPGGDMVPSVQGIEISTIRLVTSYNNIPHNNEHNIHISNIGRVHDLLEGGESMDMIIGLLSDEATNAAITRIANSNKLIGPHRADFQARAMKIIEGRKRNTQFGED